MTQHTPGPWTIRADAATRWPYAVEAIGTVAWVAWSEHMDDPDHEPLANARLIAAAPRMLAILEALDEYGYHATDPAAVKDAVNEARTILRDVEGESNG